MEQVKQIIDFLNQPITRTFLGILAGVLFLFNIFRRLRDDYLEAEIVGVSLLGLLVYLMISKGLSLIGSYSFDELPIFLVSVLVVFLMSKRKDWHFWATMEDLTSVGFLSLAISTLISLRSLGYFSVYLSNRYWRNYRNFPWYPSGRKGFVFLVNLILFSLMNLGFSFWQGRIIEIVTWFLVLVVGIIGLVILSEDKNRG